MLKLLDTRYHHGEGFDGFVESNCLSIFSMALLVFSIVGGISYATWIFIDASGVSNMAGIHITKNFLMTASDFRGKLYTDESRGIKNWMIHTDEVNGFELKHPNDWEMHNSHKDGTFLFLKTYKKNNNRDVSLLMTVEVNGGDEKKTGNPMRDIIVREGIVWQDDWKEETVNGRIGTRTGKTKTPEGLIKDAIFWEPVDGKKGFYLEATYYTDNVNDAKYNEAVFEKVISEFKFL